MQPNNPTTPPNIFVSQKKTSKNWVVATIVLAVLLVCVTVFAAWSFVNYLDNKTNSDTKVNNAVAAAKKTQADLDEAKFTQREKEPSREFVGPSDYGRVTFDYPKTWSMYVAKDASSGGTYEAYLNPLIVPAVSLTQQFALRVLIEEKDYDKTIETYTSLVNKGDLDSSSVSADGVAGTRLDGAFSKDIHGSAVIFKIRDKTLTIRTDATTFKSDFDSIVSTIKFNE